MALTDPYGQNHYIGRFASDSAAETFLTDVSWLLTDELLYYNTTSHTLRVRANGEWHSLNLAPTSGISKIDRVHVGSYARWWWMVLTTFIFRGTLAWGLPQNIRLLARSRYGAGQVRIRDITNSNTIATKTGILNSDYDIFDMGTLSNLPTGESILEVQGQKINVQEIILEY